jgi:hypothetical protein
MKLKAGLQALAAGVVLAFGAVKAEAAIIDLGFALDASGSIGSSNFVTARNALFCGLGADPFQRPRYLPGERGEVRYDRHDRDHSDN